MKTCAALLALLSTLLLGGCSSRSDNSVAANKALVFRSEVELWNRGNLSVADELYSPVFVGHFASGQEWRGIRGIKDAVSSHRASFPDWTEHIEDILADGDKVAIRVSSTGTQRGKFMDLEPSGRKITIEEIHIFRIENGKIVEQWGMPDLQSLMQQLVAPEPEPTSAK